MPAALNRASRSVKVDERSRQTLRQQDDENLEADSDALMSWAASDDDDDDGEAEEDEEGEDEENDIGNGLHMFKGEFMMPPYEHTKRRLSQLYEMMNGPYLDLAPHYQRGVVWTQKAMRLLIDSMWKGYYIPPIIFNLEVVKGEKGALRYKRTCVDGKQRLTSIHNFMSGQIPCTINRKPWFFCEPSGTSRKAFKRKILPQAAREEFMRIELLCTEYKGLTERQEIELFQRVQLGKPLSQAEAFRATQGSWQAFAKLYERDFADVMNLVKQKRASGFRQIMISFMQIFECIDPSAADGIPRFKNSIKSVEAFCSNAILDEDTKQHLRFVFSLFHDLIEEDRSTFEYNGYTRSKVFAPIEIVAVCCLLSQKGAERPNGMLRGDILFMRAHLREVHVALRMNGECWRTVWQFIDQLESYRGGVGRSTVRKQPAKPLKRKSRARPHVPDVGIVEDGLFLPRNSGNRSSIHVDTSHKPPAAKMTGRNARTNKDAGATENDHDATASSFISQLSAAASLDQVPNNDLNVALGYTRREINASNSRTPPTPLLPSPVSAEGTVERGNAPIPVARKRVALDLGFNEMGRKELESKRARLMAGYVKQEKDI